MTAPAATARTKPSESMLEEGFSSKVTIGLDADISFLEVEVTPGGYEGGDKIDQTTMFNTSRMTSAPGALYDKESGQIVVAYNPAVLSQIRAILNKHTTITNTYPDGSTEADFGWVRSFKEGALVIKGRPTATIVIEYGGQDADGNEEQPVYTAPA